MTPKDLRNLVLAALVAALCFGGSFTCTSSSHDHDDEFHGFVTVNAVLP